MKIQELEKELNITRSNIRFYEKEGLISPPRKENGYREYGEEDIAKLKKIIIFRKLGITVADIKNIFDGTLSLQTAIDNNIDRLHKEIEELNGAIEVCEQIKEDKSEEKDFPQDHFWNVINNRERKGEEFNNIFNDYLDFEKFVFFHSFRFNFDEYKEKHGIKGIIQTLLLTCLTSGVIYAIWQNSFWVGFIAPFIIFTMLTVVLAPMYYLGKRNSKLVNVYLTVLVVIIGLFLGAIALLLLYALFNTMLE